MPMVDQTHVGVRCAGSGDLIGTATRYHLPGKPESGSLSEVGLVMKDASDDWVPVCERCRSYCVCACLTVSGCLAVRGRSSCCTLAFYNSCHTASRSACNLLTACTCCCALAALLATSAAAAARIASSCCVLPLPASLARAAAVCVNVRMYMQVEGFPMALYSGSKDCTVRKWNADEAGLESVSACSSVLGFELRSCRNASRRVARLRTRRVWIRVHLIVRKHTLLCTTPL